MASTLVRPGSSLSGYADYDLSSSFRNLSLESRDEFLNTVRGILSSSSVSPSLNLSLSGTQEGDLQFSPNQPIPQEVSLGFHAFNNREDTLHPNMYSTSENFSGSMDDYTNYQYYDSFGRDSVPNIPSNPHHGMENYGLNNSSELYYRGQIDCNNQVNSSAAGNNGYYCFGDYNLPNMMQSPGSCSTGQCMDRVGLNAMERHDMAMLAMEKYRSDGLLGLLSIGDPSYTSLVLDGVIDNVMEFITYEDGFKVFRSLINQCKFSQLVMIVEKITSEPTSFGMAVSTQFGSYTVESLLRNLRVRHTELARLVTSALSFDICAMASTTWGRNVIKTCFTLLDRRANEVLHDEVIDKYYDLAMDRGGCITLNDCIETIESPRRGWLLDRICEESACLSFDPSGNHVVQKVLELRNRKYSSMICKRLQGNYVSLALIKHGSYVIEKCLKVSGCESLHFFSEEIAEDKCLLEKLARHEFGNWVVKAALEVSKMEPSGNYYRFFVEILEPCFQQLEKNKYGMHVVRQIQGRDQTSPGNGFGRH